MSGRGHKPPDIRLPRLKSRMSINLIKAIELGNLQHAVDILKSHNLDLDQPVRGTTPLSLAIILGRVRFVQLLINSGASVDRMSGDRLGRSEPPIVTACRLGKVEMARTLLKLGADINKTDFFNNTALWVATRLNRLEMLTFLFASGAAIDVRWSWYECPLYLATKYIRFNGRRSAILILLKNGVVANACDDDGCTPLYWALQNDSKESIRMLVECGARLGAMEWSRMDAIVDDELKRDAAFYGWLTAQMTAPQSLECLCMQAIRLHLVTAHKRSIIEDVAKLPLPAAVIKRLSLDGYE